MRADPPLHRLLGGPGTSWLLHRARRRMVQGKPLAGNVTLTGATADQRRAAETLLGRRPATGAEPILANIGANRTCKPSPVSVGGSYWPGLIPALSTEPSTSSRSFARWRRFTSSRR